MSNCGIAFTLPISCQICLGKVKQPVVCPNQHVFCSPCMDVWLQRSQHCPACRTPITDENPCKQILGGLSGDGDVKEDFSKNKDLRKARADVLFKEYEEELERMQNELETSKHENKVLAEQLKIHRINRTDDPMEKPAQEVGPDVETMLNLTKKLQETMASQEKHKKEKDRIKKENNYLKDENVNLGRENQQLRMELTSRSPRKYGRMAAAAMETNLESYEKENKLLQKALERSDLYVEEIEKELEKYRQFVKLYSKCPQCDNVLILKDEGKKNERKDDNEASGAQKLKGNVHRAVTWPGAQAGDDEQAKAVISGTSFYGRKPTPVKSKSSSAKLNQRPVASASGRSGGSLTTPNKLDSFGLEQPSPSTPSTVMRKLALNDTKTNDSSALDDSAAPSNDATSSTFTLENTNATAHNNSDSSLTESCRKKLRFDAGHDSDVFSRPSTSGFLSNSRSSSVDSSVAADDSLISSKQTHLHKAHTTENEATFEMPSSTSESDHEEADPNMTTDIAECLELLDAAERKVSEQRKFQAPTSVASSASASLHRPKQDPIWKVPIVNNVPSRTGERFGTAYDYGYMASSSSCATSVPTVNSSQVPSWYKGMEASTSQAPNSNLTSTYRPYVVGSATSTSAGTSAAFLAPSTIPNVPSRTNLTSRNFLFSNEAASQPIFGSSLSQNSVSSSASAFVGRDYNTLNMPGYTLSQPISTSSNVFSDPFNSK